jgi:hypothetical protein
VLRVDLLTSGTASGGFSPRKDDAQDGGDEDGENREPSVDREERGEDFVRHAWSPFDLAIQSRGEYIRLNPRGQRAIEAAKGLPARILF